MPSLDDKIQVEALDAYNIIIELQNSNKEAKIRVQKQKQLIQTSNDTFCFEQKDSVNLEQEFLKKNKQQKTNEIRNSFEIVSEDLSDEEMPNSLKDKFLKESFSSCFKSIEKNTIVRESGGDYIAEMNIKKNEPLNLDYSKSIIDNNQSDLQKNSSKKITKIESSENESSKSSLKEEFQRTQSLRQMVRNKSQSLQNESQNEKQFWGHLEMKNDDINLLNSLIEKTKKPNKSEHIISKDKNALEQLRPKRFETFQKNPLPLELINDIDFINQSSKTIKKKKHNSEEEIDEDSSEESQEQSQNFLENDEDHNAVLISFQKRNMSEEKIQQFNSNQLIEINDLKQDRFENQELLKEILNEQKNELEKKEIQFRQKQEEYVIKNEQIEELKIKLQELEKDLNNKEINFEEQKNQIEKALKEREELLEKNEKEIIQMKQEFENEKNVLAQREYETQKQKNENEKLKEENKDEKQNLERERQRLYQEIEMERQLLRKEREKLNIEIREFQQKKIALEELTKEKTEFFQKQKQQLENEKQKLDDMKQKLNFTKQQQDQNEQLVIEKQKHLLQETQELDTKIKNLEKSTKIMEQNLIEKNLQILSLTKTLEQREIFLLKKEEESKEIEKEKQQLMHEKEIFNQWKEIQIQEINQKTYKYQLYQNYENNEVQKQQYSSNEFPIKTFHKVYDSHKIRNLSPKQIENQPRSKSKITYRKRNDDSIINLEPLNSHQIRRSMTPSRRDGLVTIFKYS